VAAYSRCDGIKETSECYISRSDGDNFIASRGARGDDTVSIVVTNIRMAPSKDESKLGAIAMYLCFRDFNILFLGSKRKATDEPSTPSASKRIKSSHSDSPEPKKIPAAGNPIPFPEKVKLLSSHTLKATDKISGIILTMWQVSG
jgi:hypothetical protein